MSAKPSKVLRVFALGVSACAAAMLGGCASVVLDESTFFADPAAFAMYDCAQLAGVRTSYAKRIEELQGLMAKAETGAGGAVVAEVAYRPDYVSAQAKLKSANAAWERNRCASANQSVDPAFARPSPGMEPAAGRSKSRIY
jgi:hypothetical protein